jgi:hypothetical protein
VGEDELSQRDEVRCPQCGAEAARPADVSANIVKCANCGYEWFVELNEGVEHAPPQPETATQFDSLRIRQTIALRRALHRARAYSVIASIACAAVAAQCAYLAWQQVRAGNLGIRVMALLIVMTGATAGVMWFARRAAALKREAARSHLAEPEVAPDFSTLSDGSQRSRNLEQLR